jgi:hypothetical protein
MKALIVHGRVDNPNACRALAQAHHLSLRCHAVGDQAISPLECLAQKRSSPREPLYPQQITTMRPDDHGNPMDAFEQPGGQPQGQRLPTFNGIEVILLEQSVGQEQRLCQLAETLDGGHVTPYGAPAQNGERLGGIEGRAARMFGGQNYGLIAGTQAALIGEALHAAGFRWKGKGNQ